MFQKLKITCDEATTICDKNQYGEATLVEKIKLNLHFLQCKICMLYTKQNVTLTKIYKGYSKSCRTATYTLSEDDKEALKVRLKKK